MPKLTITEALAEIKTNQSRIQKKRETIMRYFSRDAKLRDPITDEGGTQAFVKKERQSIGDLEGRIVKIRSAIQDVNLKTSLTIGGATKTVAEWLNWRREISNGQKAFLASMASHVSQVRAQAMRQGMKVAEGESYTPGDVVIAVGEQELAREIEGMETVLGTLDGKLSLLNATTTVDVD